MTIFRFHPNKAIYRFFILTLLVPAFILLYTIPAIAEHMVNWNSLNLNAGQSAQIARLENEWRQTYSQIQPQIERDRNELKRLFNDPNAHEQQVMMIQSRLHKNEERLRNEATRIFMNKKKLLNPQQKARLQDMIRH